MWHSHKTAVLSTYWTNCYHRFFFMTFRTKMIHRVFPEYFSVKIGGTGQPLNYSWLCCMCSPHPIISAVSLDPEIPVSYGRRVSAGWENSLLLLWGILGKGAKLGEMWWEWVEVRRAVWEMQKILFPRSFGICLLGRKNIGGHWCRYCKI